MLTNAAESTPILVELKEDLHDQNKWVSLVNCQTTQAAQLEVLWRAVATVPTSSELWGQLIQTILASGQTQTAVKVLKQAILQFPASIEFWKLVMQLDPSYEVFSAALERIDGSLVWPGFLQFLENAADLPLETRIDGFRRAIGAGVCSLEQVLPQATTLAEPLLMAFKPASWPVWEPIVRETTNAQLLCDALQVFNGSKHEAEIVCRLAHVQPGGFREKRSFFVHFLEHCSSLETYTAVYAAAVALYEAEIESCHEWSVNQLLLTEFRNLIRKRKGQVSDIVIKHDPNNVQFWLDRADMWLERPHVAAHVIEQAIETIDASRAHNGDLADIYVRYANLLLYNGSDMDVACQPLYTCLGIRKTSNRERAKLYTALAEIKNGRDPQGAVAVLENALNDQSLEPIHAHLWRHYFELIAHRLEADDLVLAGFSRCCIRREVTIRIVLQVSAHFPDGSSNQQAVLEKGVSLFPEPLSLPIWKRYLEKAGNNALFNRAFTAYLPYAGSYEEIVLVYAQQEPSVLSVRKAVARVIDRTSNVDVWKLYISTFADIEGKRKAYEQAIERLRDIESSNMALEMAQFEENLQEIQRSRELYRYAASTHRSDKILNAWEQFERRHTKLGFVQG